MPSKTINSKKLKHLRGKGFYRSSRSGLKDFKILKEEGRWV
jgi:hypothetical protein